MDRNSWWSFITPPSPEPQTVTLKPKIVSSLSFKVTVTYQRPSESLYSIGWPEKKKKKTPHPSYLQQIKGPSTMAMHLPHHAPEVTSFGFCGGMCGGAVEV
ncbi:hypothetical protein ACB092_11G053600 [Castanea dentata]